MQTTTEFAAYVEVGDTVNHLEMGLLKVYKTDDNLDLVRLWAHDEHGETVRLSVPPFSHLTVVLSLYDADPDLIP